MNLMDTLLSALVDTAFPLLTDTDFCRPDCYPPLPVFPPLDMRQYSGPVQEDDHV